MYRTCNNCLFYDNGNCSIHFRIINADKQYVDKRGNVYYSKPLQNCVKATTIRLYSKLNEIWYNKIGKNFSETEIHKELIKIHRDLNNKSN